MNAVLLSEANICGIPKQQKTCFNFSIFSSVVMDSFEKFLAIRYKHQV